MPTEFMTFKEHVENDAKLALHMLEQCADDSSRQAALIEMMVNDHRTHQQSFTRLVLAYLKELANNEYDQRNEAAVNVARKLTQHKESILDTYLPYI